jgi:membrane-associated phospholipid phosphatase
MAETPAPAEPASVADMVADSRPRHEDRFDRMLRQLGALDRAVYGAVADTPTPDLDEPLRRLSHAASYSRLWVGIAGGIALIDGRRGREAAVTGLVAIGVTSAVVNQGLKRLYPRQRPDRDGEAVPQARRVKMPDSTSFPSGHSASGFAFATAVGSQLPWTGAALRFLAATVAYSRVHTGVHYPGDAVVGSLVGGGIGSAVATAARQLTAAAAQDRARIAEPRP